MSVTRISIVAAGLVAMFILGTWGWTELVNAAYRAQAPDPVMVLAVYGVALLPCAVVAGLTYLALACRNADLR